MRMNNSERIWIYQESSQCSNNIDNTFWPFLCFAFPRLEISITVAKEFRNLTYESDRFPQYTCVCLLRLRNKIRVSVHCEIFKIYEDSCLRRGQFIKLGKSSAIQSPSIGHRPNKSCSRYNYKKPCWITKKRCKPSLCSVDETIGKMHKILLKVCLEHWIYCNSLQVNWQPEHPSIDKYKQKTFHSKLFMTSEGSNENTIITRLNKNC